MITKAQFKRLSEKRESLLKLLDEKALGKLSLKKLEGKRDLLTTNLLKESGISTLEFKTIQEEIEKVGGLENVKDDLINVDMKDVASTKDLIGTSKQIIKAVGNLTEGVVRLSKEIKYNRDFIQALVGQQSVIKELFESIDEDIETLGNNQESIFGLFQKMVTDMTTSSVNK